MINDKRITEKWNKRSDKQKMFFEKHRLNKLYG